MEQVEELYWLLGHKVTNIARRNKTTTDLAITSNRGDRWIVRCEYVHEVNESAVSNFTRLLQTENVNQAAIISAGKFTPEARRLVSNETVYFLDGTVFQDYLNRARALVWEKVNPISLAAKRIAWRITRRFVQRTYRPLPQETYGRTSQVVSQPKPIFSGMPEEASAVSNPPGSYIEMPTYKLGTPPGPKPRRMFPQGFASPREENVYTTDDHGVVISMEEYRELHKR